jgi:hypothetical protein
MLMTAKLGAALSTIGGLGLYSSPDGDNWTLGQAHGQFLKPSMGAAVAFFNGQLWMAYVADGTNNLLRICSSTDGITWSGPTDLPGLSKATPSLAVFAGRLWMGIIASNASNTIMISSSPDGSTWDPFVDVPGTSKAGVALASWNGRLWLALVANNASNELLIGSTQNGTDWTTFDQVGGSMAVGQAGGPGPALAVFDGRLYLGLIANNASLQPLVMWSADGAIWQPNVVVDTGQRYSAGLAAFAGQLWMSFAGSDPGLGFLIRSSYDGVTWSDNHVAGPKNYGLNGGPVGLVAWG